MDKNSFRKRLGKVQVGMKTLFLFVVVGLVVGFYIGRAPGVSAATLSSPG